MSKSYWWILATMGTAALAAGACTAGGGSQFSNRDVPEEPEQEEPPPDDSFDPGDMMGPGDTLCDATADSDLDGDGYTFNTGDCNDCDANVNPDAIEVQTDLMDPEAKEVDENCDGEVDEVIPSCDTGFMVGDMDPLNAAAALDICGDANTNPWGLKGAAWVRANGAPVASGHDLAVGLMPDFGVNMPRNGDSLVVISSGYARDASETGACSGQSCQTTGNGVPPVGFPQDVPGCSGLSEIRDDVALEVELVAPSNATGYSFEFAFMSFEFPEYVCTSYNDQFIALVDPAPQGSINGNISFDAQTNPVSVNVAYFDNCDPAGIGSYASLCFAGNCPQPPQPYCPLGSGFMTDTGFNEWGDAGSTGWLVTTAPVQGGDQFKVRFAIWDTGDQNLDSTVMLDNFRWIATGGTVAVGTLPAPQ